MKADIYTISLLKKHFVYIILFVGLTVFAMIFIPIKLTDYKDNEEKTGVLRQEITSLTEKYSTLSRYSSQEMDDLVQIVNRLVPDQYDYFNLYGAIDDFQRLSGLKFTSVSAPFTSLSSEGAVLSVTAEGSNAAILQFLENYQTIGGRLATVNAITFKPSATTISFILTLHAQKAEQAPSSTAPKLDDNTIALLRKLYTQIPQTAPASEDVPVQPIGAGKQNPFGE